VVTGTLRPRGAGAEAALALSPSESFVEHTFQTRLDDERCLELAFDGTPPPDGRALLFRRIRLDEGPGQAARSQR
jgi:hypothetical protein